MRLSFDAERKARALILIPGSLNYFYNLSGRRLAESLGSLGVEADVATLAETSGDGYDWCVISNVSEVVASFGDEAAALSKLQRIRAGCLFMASLSMDCVQTGWYQRICDLSRSAGADCVLDLGLAPQSPPPSKVKGRDRLAYRFLFSGLTPSERERLDQLDALGLERRVPWAFVGHITEPRAALVDRLVHEVDPSGFVYIPSLSPYTENDSPHLNQQEFERVLEHARYQVWCSHHEHFYLEPERFRSSLLTGGVPIKVVDAQHPDKPEGAPFEYLVLMADDLRRLSKQSFPETVRRFRADWRSLPTLDQGLGDLLIETGLADASCGSRAA